MHWADVVALNLSKRGTKHIVSTGITPSGEFHIGHLREILTGEMISRAAKNAGLEVDFIFIVDDADPLRRVYPFLDEEFSKFIGHQIGNIPAPDIDGKPDYERFNTEGWNYADHFLNPFLDALKAIGVRPRIVKNLSSYQSGRFSECSKIACDNGNTYAAGALLSLLEMLSLDAYRHDVIALEECRVIGINRAEIKTMWNRDNKLAWPLSCSIAATITQRRQTRFLI